MKSKPILFLAMLLPLCLAGCSTTTLYDKGQPVARFQGDMTGTTFSRGADGSMTWEATTVDHSAPTTAAGSAASKGILSGGTAVATSGLVKVIH